jgi:hypothetical protein
VSDYQFPNGALWYDPCAGHGAIIRAVDSRRSHLQWMAHEIRPECAHELNNLAIDVQIGDALTHLAINGIHNQVRVIITNPPYELAEDFAEQMIGNDGATVCFLLRLNWLASTKRHQLLSHYIPDIYVLPNRPSFTDSGTDACDYAWFVWPHHNHRRTIGKIEILDTTPKEQR